VYVCHAIQYIDLFAVSCSELQCVAVWCSALHCVCMQRNTIHRSTCRQQKKGYMHEHLSCLLSLVSCLLSLSCLLTLMSHVSCLMSHVSYLSRVSCVYIHPLADKRRKGRCVSTHGTSATTPAAIASATSVGRTRMTGWCIHCLTPFPPSTQTHTNALSKYRGEGYYERDCRLPIFCPLLPVRRL